jgi:baculoviral IAP repeat-containing protein 7/8
MTAFVDLVCSGGELIQNFALKHNPPKHLFYVSEDRRRKSFKGCSSIIEDKVEKLIQAGFYFKKESNTTVCFCCDGELTCWGPGDNEWLDHSRWFSSCLFVNLVKGRDFLNRAKKLHSKFLKGLPNSFSGDDSVFKESWRSEDIAFFLSIGITKNVLWSISQKFIQEQGRGFLSRVEMSEAVGEALTFEAPEIEESPGTRTNIEPLCNVCGVEEKNIVFVPCAHLSTCGACAASVSKCPYCRQPILGVFKVFIV